MRQLGPLILSFTLAFAAVTALGLTICSKCGFEAATGVLKCVNCGNALQGNVHTAVDVPESVREPDRTTAPEITYSMSLEDRVAIVEAELQLVKKGYEKGRFGLAYLTARNAAALAVAMNTDDRYEKQAIAAGRNAEKSGSIRRIPCVACNGSGKRIITRQGLSEGTEQSFNSRSPCKTCNGSGEGSGRRKLGSWKKQVASNLLDYVKIQQKRGYVPEGRAWIPGDWEGQLTLESRATLRRMLPPECEECEGVGKLECNSCDGHGYEDCRARGCKDGKVMKKSEGLGGGAVARETRCRDCGGKGQVICEDCGSKGLQACDKCHETGLPPVCVRCQGTGIGKCRSCRGAGERRDEQCETCQGSGKALCSGCDGYGHDD